MKKGILQEIVHKKVVIVTMEIVEDVDSEDHEAAAVAIEEAVEEDVEEAVEAIMPLSPVITVTRKVI